MGSRMLAGGAATPWLVEGHILAAVGATRRPMEEPCIGSL